jgi:hypothetical protein
MRNRAGGRSGKQHAGDERPHGQSPGPEGTSSTCEIGLFLRADAAHCLTALRSRLKRAYAGAGACRGCL